MPEIDCLKCEHFEITWNKNFPRACKVFEIKTPNFPSVDVKRATGKQCPAFKMKPGVKPGPGIAGGGRSEGGRSAGGGRSTGGDAPNGRSNGGRGILV